MYNEQLARSHRVSSLRQISALTGSLAFAALGFACSSDADNGSSDDGSEPSATSSLRTPGPVADLQEIRGGNGVNLGSSSSIDLNAIGYVENELVAWGTATSYLAQGALTRDGSWSFQPGSSSDYRTRVLVRRPSAAADFSGTVVIEWLNVSGGTDSDVIWSSTHEELTRQGHVWAGVSAQLIGVMGGPELTPTPGGDGTSDGLTGSDPVRYGALVHPGDGYSFDIFSQAARALRAGGTPLGGLKPERLLAAGQSQSAYGLVTYIDGVQPLAHVFDGFFLHSRGSGGLALAAAGQPASLGDATAREAALLRVDTDVPVFDIQAEGDLVAPLNYLVARQPDNDHYHVWEVAGAAHADLHTVGPFASMLGCAVPINNAPMHVVVKAALHTLVEWVSTGSAPAPAPRIEVSEGSAPQIVRDADGIAKGGVRTPPVDVPVDVLSGVPAPSSGATCILFGSTTPLPAERIAALYPTSDAYLQRYRTAADSAVQAGFTLEPDREALLGYAQPSRIP
jgi:hypothetical protein